MISEVQQPLFVKHYATPAGRFHLLPPGIAADRRAPAKIGHAAMPLGSGAMIYSGFNRIDAEGRSQIVAKPDIGSGKPEPPAARIAMLDPPLDLPRTAEQSRRAPRLSRF